MAKGGTTSSNTQIPAYLEDAVRENINRARDVSQIGYTPYYGADVAAFSPMQQQSMRSTGNAASAFGLAPEGFDAMAGMPQAQTFAGGVQGYSSAPLYEQSLDKLFANAPAQYNAMNDMFIDPFTGARSRNNYGNASPVMGMARTGGGNGGDGYSSTMEHHNAFLNRMREEGASDVYDSIYQQTYTAGDLVNGDTFVGDDGLNYTVGYDVGQVDPSLANAVQRNKINEVRSNSSAVGSIVGNTLQGFPLSRLFEGITGTAPFNSNDASRSSLSNVDVNDGRFANIIGYEQENARAQYDQRGDMYPPQIQGGLLGNSDYQAYDGELILKQQEMAQARMQEDIRAAQEAEKFAAFVAKQEADLIKLNQLNNAVAPVVAPPVVKTTVNSNNGGAKGNNDSWQGTNSSGTAKKGFSFGL